MDLITLGLAIGMANALLAVGIVLIYMSTRVINMAHGEFGAFCVAMMIWLTRYHHLNYFAALAISLIATGVLAAIVERTIIARLWRSPRLLVLIATLGVAQLIIVLRLVIPKPKIGAHQSLLAAGGNIFPVPFHFQPVVWDRVILQPGHFLALGAGPVLALALGAFLRWSPYGVALRAAAENAPRARLLGIPVRRVSTIAWVISALFAGAAAVLLAPVIGFSATEAVGLPILMRGLAAATIARMESVGRAFGVGLALGVADQLVYFWTGRSGLTDVVLLAVIVVVLLGRQTSGKRTVASEESSWDITEPVRALPTEIATHPQWRLLVSVLTAVGVTSAVLAPMVLDVAPTFFLSAVFLIASVVVSLTVLTGWAGQLSLGQWALAGVGGVFGAKLVADSGVPFWLALVGAMAAGAVVAFLLGLPALRLEGSELAVVTLGFAVAAGSWLFDAKWFSPQGFFQTPAYLSTDVLYAVTLVYLVLVMLATRRLQRGAVGRNIVAARDNPRQAAAFGVSVARAKLTAFVFAGSVSAGAGFLWSASTGLPSTLSFPPVRSLSVVSAAVIGGLGTIPGAVLGAFYLWGVPYFAAGVTPYIGLLATGAGVLALLLFLPGGMARVLTNGRDRLAALVTGIDPRPDVTPSSLLDATPGEVTSATPSPRNQQRPSSAPSTPRRRSEPLVSGAIE